MKEIKIKDEFIVRSLGEFSFDPEKKFAISEILGIKSDDDDKLWNYVTYWNQAVDLLEKGESQKSLSIFKKLSEGRPNDKVATYFIKKINEI